MSRRGSLTERSKLCKIRVEKEQKKIEEEKEVLGMLSCGHERKNER